MDAEGGVLDCMHDVGAVNQHLGRDAATVQAFAAEGTLLNHRYRAAGGRHVRGHFQAGTRTDQYKVKRPHQILQPIGG